MGDRPAGRPVLNGTESDSPVQRQTGRLISLVTDSPLCKVYKRLITMLLCTTETNKKKRRIIKTVLWMKFNT